MEPRSQRGRGRRGGRAVSGRGRMRKRGFSGGGTLRRKSPQQGHRPSSAMGPVASARSQWPRASHNGLMHCTVKPGRYCMRAPSVASQTCVCEKSRVTQIPWAARTELLERIVALLSCGVKKKEYKGLWYGCRETVIPEWRRLGTAGHYRK